MADLDRPARGSDPQVARYTYRFARGVVDDCVEQRVAAAAIVVHPTDIQRFAVRLNRKIVNTPVLVQEVFSEERHAWILRVAQ